MSKHNFIKCKITKAAALLLTFVLVLTMLPSCKCFDFGGNNVATDESGKPIVSYIDVGQGDSEFIEFSDGECMLIDSGEQQYSTRVIRYIRNRGYKKIDYILVTHPHSDHMGGMSDIISEFDVGKVYMTNAVSTTAIFNELLDTISDKGLKISRAKKGVNIKTAEGLSVNLLSPVSDEYDNINNYSSVCRIVYGKTAFLFMGDAETLAENELGGDLSCDVIKIGHHGSSSSSGKTFAAKTGASYGILSLGEGNDYGHPHKSTVDTWRKLGTLLLRTDECGTICFGSDGQKVSYTTEKGSQNGENTTQTDSYTAQNGENDAKWVLNTSSKKVHTPDCSSVNTISEKNKEYSNESLETLIKNGYTLCGSCHPSEE